MDDEPRETAEAAPELDDGRDDGEVFSATIYVAASHERRGGLDSALTGDEHDLEGASWRRADGGEGWEPFEGHLFGGISMGAMAAFLPLSILFIMYLEAPSLETWSATPLVWVARFLLALGGIFLALGMGYGILSFIRQRRAMRRR